MAHSFRRHPEQKKLLKTLVIQSRNNIRITAELHKLCCEKATVPHSGITHLFIIRLRDLKTVPLSYECKDKDKRND